MMISRQFFGWVLLISYVAICNGDIWELEDGTVTVDTESEPSATEAANTCLDANGSQGRCVPKEECNPYHDLFASLNETEKMSISDWVLLNLTESSSEACYPNTPVDEVKTTPTPLANYVCCTTYKYAERKKTTFEEYFANEPADEPLPEIPVTAQNTPNFTIKITMGREATKGEFPYTVAITANGRQFCGGSLVSAQWVLTAGHCFDMRMTQAGIRELVIKIGDHDIYNANDAHHQDRTVSKAFLHPGFFRGNSGHFRDDLALLKLKTPVTVSGNIRTVPLYSGPPINPPKDAVVSGWGKVCGGSCGLSRVIRTTRVSVISNAQCSQRYASTGAPQITKKMVCAQGSNGQDACNGDSGGPLVIYSGGQTYQIGIVSWGIGCGQYPGVYTRVSSFTEWIGKYMNSSKKIVS